jgi:hypothetical protein
MSKESAPSASKGAKESTGPYNQLLSPVEIRRKWSQGSRVGALAHLELCFEKSNPQKTGVCADRTVGILPAMYSDMR